MTTYPLYPSLLSIKLQAEAIEATQAADRMPAGEAKNMSQAYSDKLDSIAEFIGDLIDDGTPARMTVGYRKLKKEIQDRIDCVTSVQSSTEEGRIRNAAEARASIFLLGEITKMGI